MRCIYMPVNYIMDNFEVKNLIFDKERYSDVTNIITNHCLSSYEIDGYKWKTAGSLIIDYKDDASKDIYNNMINITNRTWKVFIYQLILKNNNLYEMKDDKAIKKSFNTFLKSILYKLSKGNKVILQIASQTQFCTFINVLTNYFKIYKSKRPIVIYLNEITPLSNNSLFKEFIKYASKHRIMIWGFTSSEKSSKYWNDFMSDNYLQS